MSQVLRFTDGFHQPGPRSPVTWQGRIYFLEDVHALEPAVLEELRGLHGRRLDPRAREVDRWARHWWLTPVDPEADHWPRAVALATLEHWREHAEFLEQTTVERLGLQWHFPSHGVHSPLTQAEEAARRRARRGKRGRSRFQVLVRQRGFEPTPMLRNRKAFTRLALAQVCGWSPTDLSDLREKPEQRREFQRQGLNAIDKRTLREGLHRTAKMIGLKRRNGWQR